MKVWCVECRKLYRVETIIMFQTSCTCCQYLFQANVFLFCNQVIEEGVATKPRTIRIHSPFDVANDVVARVGSGECWPKEGTKSATRIIKLKLNSKLLPPTQRTTEFH